MARRALMSAGLVIVMALSLGTPAWSAPVQAQSNTNSSTQANTGNGLRISPVRQDLTIKPGATQTIDVYVQNITSSPARLRAVINDFVASDDESGKPRILLDDKTAAPKNSLKGFVRKIDDLTLQPQQQRIVKVQIAIPADAAGGGYFGAVRFLPSDTDTSKNVSLAASVGTLLLVTVPGDVKEQASLASLNVARDGGKASSFFTTGDGLQAIVRVRNMGNVQVSPFGKLVLKKSGKEVSTYEINDVTPRGSILPDSIRRFSVDLSGKANSFGKYTLEGNLGYGSSGQLLTGSTSFYVVPLPIVIIAIILLLAIILAAVIIPRMLKSHDRKLIKKIRGRK